VTRRDVNSFFSRYVFCHVTYKQIGRRTPYTTPPGRQAQVAQQQPSRLSSLQSPIPTQAKIAAIAHGKSPIRTSPGNINNNASHNMYPTTTNAPSPARTTQPPPQQTNSASPAPSPFPHQEAQLPVGPPQIQQPQTPNNTTPAYQARAAPHAQPSQPAYPASVPEIHHAQLAQVKPEQPDTSPAQMEIAQPSNPMLSAEAFAPENLTFPAPTHNPLPHSHQDDFEPFSSSPSSQEQRFSPGAGGLNPHMQRSSPPSPNRGPPQVTAASPLSTNSSVMGRAQPQRGTAVAPPPPPSHAVAGAESPVRHMPQQTHPNNFAPPPAPPAVVVQQPIHQPSEQLQPHNQQQQMHSQQHVPPQGRVQHYSLRNPPHEGPPAAPVIEQAIQHRQPQQHNVSAAPHQNHVCIRGTASANAVPASVQPVTSAPQQPVQAPVVAPMQINEAEIAELMDVAASDLAKSDELPAAHPHAQLPPAEPAVASINYEAAQAHQAAQEHTSPQQFVPVAAPAHPQASAALPTPMNIAQPEPEPSHSPLPIASPESSSNAQQQQRLTPPSGNSYNGSSPPGSKGASPLKLPFNSPLRSPLPTDPEELRKYVFDLMQKEKDKEKEISALRTSLLQERSQVKQLQLEVFEKERTKTELEMEMEMLNSKIAFKDKDLQEVQQQLEKALPKPPPEAIVVAFVGTEQQAANHLPTIATVPVQPEAAVAIAPAEQLPAAAPVQQAPPAAAAQPETIVVNGASIFDFLEDSVESLESVSDDENAGGEVAATKAGTTTKSTRRVARAQGQHPQALELAPTSAASNAGAPQPQQQQQPATPAAPVANAAPPTAAAPRKRTRETNGTAATHSVSFKMNAGSGGDKTVDGDGRTAKKTRRPLVPAGRVSLGRAMVKPTVVRTTRQTNASKASTSTNSNAMQNPKSSPPRNTGGSSSKQGRTSAGGSTSSHEENQQLKSAVTQLKERLRGVKRAIHGEAVDRERREFTRETKNLRTDLREILHSELEEFGQVLLQKIAEGREAEGKRRRVADHRPKEIVNLVDIDGDGKHDDKQQTTDEDPKIAEPLVGTSGSTGAPSVDKPATSVNGETHKVDEEVKKANGAGESTDAKTASDALRKTKRKLKLLYEKYKELRTQKTEVEHKLATEHKELLEVKKANASLVDQSEAMTKTLREASDQVKMGAQLKDRNAALEKKLKETTLMKDKQVEKAKTLATEKKDMLRKMEDLELKIVQMSRDKEALLEVGVQRDAQMKKLNERNAELEEQLTTSRKKESEHEAEVRDLRETVERLERLAEQKRREWETERAKMQAETLAAEEVVKKVRSDEAQRRQKDEEEAGNDKEKEKVQGEAEEEDGESEEPVTPSLAGITGLTALSATSQAGDAMLTPTAHNLFNLDEDNNSQDLLGADEDEDGEEEEDENKESEGLGRKEAGKQGKEDDSRAETEEEEEFVPSPSISQATTQSQPPSMKKSPATRRRPNSKSRATAQRKKATTKAATEESQAE
jgi:hypothetical protein